MSHRLTKTDWIRHGLRTLAAEGPHALKVGPMAEKLKVSRGSFYWHFADIAEFRSELLRNWQERSTEQVIEEIANKAGRDRLRYLLRRAFVEKRSLDRAIRSWAAEDDDVAAAVVAVDARRIGYIAKLLVDAGVESSKAPPRATFLYWAYLGHAAMRDPRHSTIAASAMDDISTLFET
jgi:AcrR family transcriptional regulator